MQIDIPPKNVFGQDHSQTLDTLIRKEGVGAGGRAGRHGLSHAFALDLGQCLITHLKFSLRPDHHYSIELIHLYHVLKVNPNKLRFAIGASSCQTMLNCRTAIDLERLMKT